MEVKKLSLFYTEKTGCRICDSPLSVLKNLHGNYPMEPGMLQYGMKTACSSRREPRASVSGEARPMDGTG